MNIQGFEHLNRAKEKIMAYVLNTEFGYSKSAIARLMGISPQQMGQWIKEAGYEIQIRQLGNELDEARRKLKSLGYQPVKELNPNDFSNL